MSHTYTPKNCIVCSQEFQPRGSTQKYCDGCNPKKQRKQPKSFTCLQCGEAFQSHNPQSKYCSKECGTEHRASLRIAPERVCTNCECTFNGYGSYCSDSCRQRAQLAADTTSLLVNFGDVPLYGLDFRNALHAPVL